MKRIISTVAAAGLLAGALMAPVLLRAEDKPEGKPEAHGEKGGKEAFMERMREKFGLSEEQETKLKAAHRAKRDAAAASMAELGSLTRKLQDQLEDKAAEKDLSATLDKIVAARKAMRADEDKFEASLTSILTPTQRAKMLVAMKGHGGGMRGGNMGGKMGGGMKGGGMKGGPNKEKGDD
jgi:Spy/CpxP family protein refolding chaperone